MEAQRHECWIWLTHTYTFSKIWLKIKFTNWCNACASANDFHCQNRALSVKITSYSEWRKQLCNHAIQTRPTISLLTKICWENQTSPFVRIWAYILNTICTHSDRSPKGFNVWAYNKWMLVTIHHWYLVRY